MIYQKNKIKRLLEYKDKINNQEIKNDIEWLINNYNENYTELQEYERKKKEYREMYSRYFEVVDKNFDLKNKIRRLNQKITNIKSCNKI